jgi:hypothetical protein
VATAFHWVSMKLDTPLLDKFMASDERHRDGDHLLGPSAGWQHGAD